MDLHKKKKNCPYCLCMRCCLDHCCNWDNCKCGDCILCGGAEENEYTPDEKRNLQASFRALELIEANKNETKPLKDKPTNDNKPNEYEKNNNNKSVNHIQNQSQDKKEEIIAKEKLDASINSTLKTELKNKTNAGNDEADRVRKLVEETTKRTNETLATISRTLASLKKTQEDCRETDKKFQDFQDKFQDALNSFAVKMSEGLSEDMAGPMHKRQSPEKFVQPTISDIESVAEILITKTNIVILTGAGISVASGLPTFRGKGGLWTTKKNETIKAEEFLSYSYFQKNPEEVWDWHYDFKRMVRLSEPNVSHLAIAEIQNFADENDLKCTIITQNIDNFHVESYYKIQFSLLAKYSSEEEESKSLSLSPNKFNQESPYYGFNEGIYEIHGNINYMRCDNSCTNKLFPSPDVLLSSFNKGELPLPKCPLCQGLARPHTLFFDESFNEDFYKRDTVLKKLEDMDCLVVIGTMLETNLASKIVGEAISKECLIIEINPTPIIECGNVLQLIGESEKIIPNVWKMARMKFFEYYDNEKMSKN